MTKVVSILTLRNVFFRISSSYSEVFLLSEDNLYSTRLNEPETITKLDKNYLKEQRTSKEKNVPLVWHAKEAIQRISHEHGMTINNNESPLWPEAKYMVFFTGPEGGRCDPSKVKEEWDRMANDPSWPRDKLQTPAGEIERLCVPNVQKIINNFNTLKTENVVEKRSKVSKTASDESTMKKFAGMGANSKADFLGQQVNRAIALAGSTSSVVGQQGLGAQASAAGLAGVFAKDGVATRSLAEMLHDPDGKSFKRLKVDGGEGSDSDVGEAEAEDDSKRKKWDLNIQRNKMKREFETKISK